MFALYMYTDYSVLDRVSRSVSSRSRPRSTIIDLGVHVRRVSTLETTRGKNISERETISEIPAVSSDQCPVEQK